MCSFGLTKTYFNVYTAMCRSILNLGVPFWSFQALVTFTSNETYFMIVGTDKIRQKMRLYGCVHNFLPNMNVGLREIIK